MPRPHHHRKLAYFGVAMALVFGSISPGIALADFQVDSGTLVRWYEGEPSGSDTETALPVYEYLRVGAGNLKGDGFSVHAYGWGRFDVADSDLFNDRSQGEFLYGYLQFRSTELNASARLGRQAVFTGVSNETLDGLRLTTGLTPYFSVDVYGGQPVPLEIVDGRTKDGILGGRIGHHWGSLYEVGVSYKKVGNDGDKEEEMLGIDSFLNLPYGVSLSGFSTRNLISEGWAEHSYGLSLAWGDFLIRPSFHQFRYGDYFDTGKNTGTPFRFLTNSDETVTQIGGDVAWTPRKWLTLELKFNSYDYREEDDTAQYYAGIVTLHGKRRSQVGGEVGRMDGDTKDTRYTLFRGFMYWDRAPLFVTADGIYVGYDEDILGEDRSIFASLGAGASFFKESLELKLSADASSDPYFDHDYRGMLAVRYLFDL